MYFLSHHMRVRIWLHGLDRKSGICCICLIIIPKYQQCVGNTLKPNKAPPHDSIFPSSSPRCDYTIEITFKTHLCTFSHQRFLMSYIFSQYLEKKIACYGIFMICSSTNIFSCLNGSEVTELSFCATRSLQSLPPSHTVCVLACLFVAEHCIVK